MATPERPLDETTQAARSFTVDGRRYQVSVRISYDGVEYVGRLWFTDGDPSSGIADRGIIPGHTKEEVLELLERLSEEELHLRYRRAVANRRRYLSLRNVTDDILRKVRYLNQVAISMRAGMIDMDGAAQEIDLTEQQLHELVRQLRSNAGVEDAAG
ncbi:MAG: hypothetical protein ABJD07_16175 [Gemmatimonadaceae bacterium]